MASVTSPWQDLLVKWSDKERAEHVGSALIQPVNAASFLHRQLFFQYFSFPALPVTGLMLKWIQAFSLIGKCEEYKEESRSSLPEITNANTQTHTIFSVWEVRDCWEVSVTRDLSEMLCGLRRKPLLLSWLTGRKPVESRNLCKRPENVWLDHYSLRES